MDKSNQKKQNEEKLEEQLEELQEEQVVSGNVHREMVSKEEYEAMKQLAVQFENSLKRMAADYQNLQRRTQEQKGEWIKSANKDLLLKLLPVFDTLILAKKHVDDKGLQISVDQFLKVLEQEGLTRIKTIGEIFDPYTMEAITTQEGEEGKVLEEVRAGFLLHDFVLRSAQVIVGKEKN